MAEELGTPPNAEEVAALVSVLAVAMDRYIKNRARRTIVENAKADPAKPKCRWVVEADACDFCKARGSFWADPDEVPSSSHGGCKCYLTVLFEEASGFIREKREEKRVRKIEKALSNENFFGEHKTPIGNISIDSRQFGHKAAEHMVDFGLDPSSPGDRQVFRGLVYDMLRHPDSVRLGFWHATDEYPAYFYIKAEDAIIVKAETREYVSILQGALDVNNRPNKRVQSARTVFERRR